MGDRVKTHMDTIGKSEFATERLSMFREITNENGTPVLIETHLNMKTSSGRITIQSDTTKGEFILTALEFEAMAELMMKTLKKRKDPSI